MYWVILTEGQEEESGVSIDLLNCKLSEIAIYLDVFSFILVLWCTYYCVIPVIVCSFSLSGSLITEKKVKDDEYENESLIRKCLEHFCILIWVT